MKYSAGSGLEIVVYDAVLENVAPQKGQLRGVQKRWECMNEISDNAYRRLSTSWEG